jgi:alginate O-acetyltransferase complex protein AlgI
MLFNSFEFLLFLIIIFVFYWFIFKNKIKKQNALILIASYVFYGWWDWRFLSLIILSTIIDYSIGLQLKNTKKQTKRKYLLWASCIFNLGLLAFFKYFNFFIDNWINAWEFFGIKMHRSTLSIILPVGISFYTFQTLSYTIDVYRKKLQPTNDFIAFASFVSFFPQLVAGPIERASNLLPQFYKKRVFNYEIAKNGIALIVWGLFKKMVIADSCAVYVNAIFEDYESKDSLTLILGAVYFAFQIYGDFSGYSDVAIGVSRLFGFNLMRNFNYPYFSRDIAEFWRRWHISLSTWFRDYLYIPIGGSRGSKLKQLRNVMIIFTVSGFWHGPNWTFVFWGVLNALYFIPLLLQNKNRKNLDEINTNKYLLPNIKVLFQIVCTFILTCIAWVFFRSESLLDAFEYLKRIVLLEDVKLFKYLSIERYAIELLPIVILLLIIEWFSKEKEHPIMGKYMHTKLYIVVLLIIIFGVYSSPSDFIYFQF